jgi:hypothetical protein
MIRISFEFAPVCEIIISSSRNEETEPCIGEKHSIAKTKMVNTRLTVMVMGGTKCK